MPKMTKKQRRKLLAKGLKKQITRDRKRVDQGKSMSLVKSGVPLWRPGVGDHTIDILPYLAGGHHPTIAEGSSAYHLEYYLHRDVGPTKSKVLCLNMMGYDRCPICDHQAELIEENADENKWKPLRPKQWCLFNVVCYDKGEERKGVQVWDSPFFWSMENIMDIAKKRSRGGKPSETIDFAHPDEGKSIAFTIKAPKGQNDYHKYKGFSLEDRDYEISDKLLDGCHILDEIIPIPTPEEVEELYYGSSGGRKSAREASYDEDDETSNDMDDALDLLDEAEDLADLKKIKKEFNLETKIKKSSKFKRTKRLLKEELEALLEEDDEEEEDEGLTSEMVEDMSWKELTRLVVKHELEIDPDDYEDETELAEAIIEEMELI